jgi:molybdate transport system ATP-binding protein
MLTPEDPDAAADPETATLVEAFVDRHDAAFGLTRLRIPGGALTLPGGTHLPVGAKVRVRVPARDVSLTRERATRTSILNVLPGRVTEILNPDGVLVLVGVDVGATRFWARLTRKSVRTLELAPGCEVFVQVKSVALVQ